jgi:cytochrome P450 PksS
MLGVEDRDRDAFKHAVERFTQDSSGGNLVAMLRMMPTGRTMTKMFERLAEQRRTEPDDRLITALVRANDDGDVLSDHEIVAMIFLLLLAGHDTTSNLIGSSVLALIEHPDQLERLRAEPALIDTAVEELLRFTSPVPCGATRVLLDDVEIAGTTLPKGADVLGMLISANRDESVFDEPDRLDIGRDPNRHLAFAFGTHFCLGNQLARMEARMALAGLVARFEHIELAVPRESLEWKPTQSLRGLRSLPLRLA